MTDTDSLAKVVAELRDGNCNTWLSWIAERIERLDAKMQKELSAAHSWRDLYKAGAETERAATDDAIAEIADLRARLAECEKAAPPSDDVSTPRPTDCAEIRSGKVMVLARDAAGNPAMALRKV